MSMSEKPETARVIAEALHAWMEAQPPRGWVHGIDFLAANVVCDHHGKSKFIEGMAGVISNYLTSALEEREREREVWRLELHSCACPHHSDSVTCESFNAFLKAEREEARRVITPFRDGFEAKGDRYERIKSNWFREMPGHWEVSVTVTMDQGRAAAAYLERFEPKETHP